MAVVTRAFLFTDLVDSTALLSRIGQDEMEHVRREHFRLMRQAIAEHSGVEVKTVGDQFMAVFEGATAAIACAASMQRAQQFGREQQAHGVRVRIGVSVGEAEAEAGDYFGVPVIESARLCAHAEGGQILVKDVVLQLSSTGAESARKVGAVSLKGLAAEVEASEILYERRSAVAGPQAIFVGRRTELARLRERIEGAQDGHGGTILILGEAGIGKSRIIEEACDEARGLGASVFRGRCFEGEWAAPFGPFSEALNQLARTVSPAELEADMGFNGGPLTRLAPAIRETVPGVPEPAPLAPNEEQFRILDGVSQLLMTHAKRRPVILVLDDLHWADPGSLSMLRHCARFAADSRLLILAGSRDPEAGGDPSLAESFGQLRREPGSEVINLRGLGDLDVAALASTLVEHELPPQFGAAMCERTGGNPFFVRETLLHLIEERWLVFEDGEWRGDLGVDTAADLAAGVREVLGRRIARLSEPTRKLLSAASAIGGPFSFAIAAAAAGITEGAALDAVDEGLRTQLIRDTDRPETYEFAHALIQRALYTEMNPSRRARMHRKIAELLEERTRFGLGSAAEIAYQYLGSSSIPGAEKGVDWGLKAADDAEAAYAWEQVVANLRVARSLAESNHQETWRISARLGLTLPWVSAFEEAVETARGAAAAIGIQEGEPAAAAYLDRALRTIELAGGPLGIRFALARYGVSVAVRASAAWALFEGYLIAEVELHDEDYPGMPVDNQRRRDWEAVVDALLATGPYQNYFADHPRYRGPVDQLRFERARGREAEFWAIEAARAESSGESDLAAVAFADWARTLIELGEFRTGHAAYRRGMAIAQRMPRPGRSFLMLAAYTSERSMATDERWDFQVTGARAIWPRPAWKTSGRIRLCAPRTLSPVPGPARQERRWARLPR